MEKRTSSRIVRGQMWQFSQRGGVRVEVRHRLHSDQWRPWSWSINLQGYYRMRLLSTWFVNVRKRKGHQEPAWVQYSIMSKWAHCPPPFLNGCVHWAEQEKTTDISVVLILARCVEKIAFNTEWRNAGLVRVCLSGQLILPRLEWMEINF